MEQKLYSLEEIAEKICQAQGDTCTEGVCPGFDYCRHGKNGCLVWLTKIINGEE